MFKHNISNAQTTKVIKTIMHRQRVPHLNRLSITIALVGALSLVGCQSIPIASNPSTGVMSFQENQNQRANSITMAKMAKAELIDLQYSMLRRSFAYNTEMTMSNANYRHAIEVAISEKSNDANNREDHCEEVHDDSYTKVLTDFQDKENVSIFADHDIDSSIIRKYKPYAARLDKIEEEYISCYSDYMTWKIAHKKQEIAEYHTLFNDEEDTTSSHSIDYQEVYITNPNINNINNVNNQRNSDGCFIEREDSLLVIDDNIDNDSDDDNGGIKMTVGTVIGEPTTTTNDNNVCLGAGYPNIADTNDTNVEGSTAIADPKDLPEFMPNYDYRHSKRHANEAALLNAYLLQIAKINVSGVYKPFSGRITMLPTLSYQGRNLAMSINQPIMIDLRRKEIYLWADTLAAVTSEYLDDDLGTAWKNKWLKLSLDDDSLPSGFIKDLLKAYIEATQLMLEQSDDANFSYIILDPNNPTNNQLLSLDKEKTFEPMQLKGSHHVIEHRQTEKSLKKDVQLVDKHIYDTMLAKYPEFFGDEDDVAIDELDDMDVEEGGKVVQAVTTEKNKKDKDDTSDTLTTKMIVMEYLKMMDIQADIEIEEAHDLYGNDENMSESEDMLITLQQYGLDSNSKLLWSNVQMYMPSMNGRRNAEERDVTTAFTTFSPINSRIPVYPNLPANAQNPNASNTVDLREYAKDLKKRYEQGDGTSFGRMVFTAYNGYLDRHYQSKYELESDAKENTLPEDTIQEVDMDTVNNDNNDNNDEDSDIIATETTVTDIESDSNSDEADRSIDSSAIMEDQMF